MGPRLQVARRALTRMKEYIQYDLREIVWPSSFPDPPELTQALQQRTLTTQEKFECVRRGVTRYFREWKYTFTGSPEDNQKPAADDGSDMEKGRPEEAVGDDLKALGQMGAEGVRPALQRIYMTRARAYRDALQSFVQGYQEGLKSVLAKAVEDEKAELKEVAKFGEAVFAAQSQEGKVGSGPSSPGSEHSARGFKDGQVVDGHRVATDADAQARRQGYVSESRSSSTLEDVAPHSLQHKLVDNDGERRGEQGKGSGGCQQSVGTDSSSSYESAKRSTEPANGIG